MGVRAGCAKPPTRWGFESKAESLPTFDLSQGVEWPPSSRDVSAWVGFSSTQHAQGELARKSLHHTTAQTTAHGTCYINRSNEIDRARLKSISSPYTAARSVARVLYDRHENVAKRRRRDVSYLFLSVKMPHVPTARPLTSPRPRDPNGTGVT